MNKTDCVLCNRPLNIGEFVYHSDCTTLYLATITGRTEICPNCNTTGREGLGACYRCNGYSYVIKESTKM
jgi:hypothetical protein